MSTKFFTNEGSNTLLKKFEGVFEHHTDIAFFDAPAFAATTYPRIVVMSKRVIATHPPRSQQQDGRDGCVAPMFQHIGKRADHIPTLEKKSPAAPAPLSRMRWRHSILL